MRGYARLENCETFFLYENNPMYSFAYQATIFQRL